MDLKIYQSNRFSRYTDNQILRKKTQEKFTYFKKCSQKIFTKYIQKNIFKINVFKLYSQITNQKIQILQFCSICKGEGAV